MEMFGKVRRMFFRDGKSRSEIARRTGLSRTTIKKWVKVPLGTEPKYKRASKPGKLSEFKDELVRALKADAQRPRRNRRTALALFQIIKALAPMMPNRWRAPPTPDEAQAENFTDTPERLLELAEITGNRGLRAVAYGILTRGARWPGNTRADGERTTSG